MERTIRRLARLIRLGVVTMGAFVEYAATIARRRDPERIQRQSLWIHRQASRFARVFGLQIHFRFQGDAAPLLVCNHVSYLDIVALAAVMPVRFVAKSEVRNWPWFGWLARCAGTIFIERQRHRSLLAANHRLSDSAQQSGSIVMFPEATSSDGQSVLPFRSSMLAVAVEENWPVLPVWIGYELSDGDVSREICWWGDMTLLPHLWRLLGHREIRTIIRFGKVIRNVDRKLLAIQLHEAVCELHKQNSTPVSAPTIPPVFTETVPPKFLVPA